tara:strand:+ start:171 stop:683 length:513 start_codon:yes stop_codon:yes gene_type:complete
LIIKRYFVVILFFFLINISKSWSNENIAFLDVNYIVNKSKPAVLIIKRIEKLKEKETKNLKKIEDDLKKKNEEIIKSKNLLSEKELKDKISALRKEANNFEQIKIKKINEINKKRATELNNFLQLIKPVIEEYMKENSISMIIDKKNLFMAKSKNDITKDILDLVNKKIK